MNIFRDITADRVQAIREESGLSTMQVKRNLEKEAVLNELRQMEMFEEIDNRLLEILVWLTNR